MAAGYHHGDLRRALLRAAATAIEESGPAGLSLRDLARRAGVSHAAPTHHFGDKAGLLTALAAEGYDMFARDLAATWAATGSFLEMGVTYVRFAVMHRAHFEVMFRPDLYHADDPELAAARQRASDALYAGAADLPDRPTAPAGTESADRPGAVPVAGSGSPTGSGPVAGSGSPTGSGPVAGSGSPTGSGPVAGSGSPTGSGPVAGSGSPTGSGPVAGSGSPTGSGPVAGSGSPTGSGPVDGVGSPAGPGRVAGPVAPSASAAGSGSRAAGDTAPGAGSAISSASVAESGSVARPGTPPEAMTAAGQDTREVGLAAWSMAHGFATLWLSGALPDMGADPDAAARTILRRLARDTR